MYGVLEVVGDIFEVYCVLDVVYGTLDVVDDTFEVYGVLDVVDETVVDVDGTLDSEIDGPALITAGFCTTGAVAFLVSVIIFLASLLRLSICFCVVSNIFYSTIASYNLTPLT